MLIRLSNSQGIIIPVFQNYVIQLQPLSKTKMIFGTHFRALNLRKSPESWGSFSEKWKNPDNMLISLLFLWRRGMLCTEYIWNKTRVWLKHSVPSCCVYDVFWMTTQTHSLQLMHTLLNKNLESFLYSSTKQQNTELHITHHSPLQSVAVPQWVSFSKVYRYSSSQSNLPHRYGNSHAI